MATARRRRRCSPTRPDLVAEGVDRASLLVAGGRKDCAEVGERRENGCCVKILAKKRGRWPVVLQRESHLRRDARTPWWIKVLPALR